MNIKLKKIVSISWMVSSIIVVTFFATAIIAILVSDFNQKQNVEELKEFRRRDIIISYNDRKIELSKVLTVEIYTVEKGERVHKGLYLCLDGSLGLDFERKLSEDNEYTYFVGDNRVMLIDQTDHYNYLSTKQIRAFQNTYPIGIYFKRSL